MNRYIECLNEYLEAQAPSYGDEDAHSLLEMLYSFYSSENPVFNAEIRHQFQALDDILGQLTLPENDAVFSLTAQLCYAHERQAFMDGIHVGMRLFTELNGSPANHP